VENNFSNFPDSAHNKASQDFVSVSGRTNELAIRAFAMAEETSTPPKERELNPRQKAFVAEYLIDLNATQAYIRAGYSPATAQPGSAELLSNPIVAAAVERGKAQRLARVNITADSILSEMHALATSCVEHYYIDDFGNLKLTDEAPDNAMAAVSSIKKKIRHDKGGGITYEVEFRLWDKPGSLKLMGKHANVKACFDKMEVTGPDGGPLQVEQVRSVIVDPKEVHE
jgi:phage terminase small subunit